MMDQQHLGRMCSPRTAGFAEWRIDRLERTIKPTDAQRAKFDEFKAASTKAAETMRPAWPTEVPTTMVGRMEAMEKRLDAMSQAIKTARPALEAFYATLSDEQKAQFNSDRGIAAGSGDGATVGSPCVAHHAELVIAVAPHNR